MTTPNRLGRRGVLALGAALAASQAQAQAQAQAPVTIRMWTFLDPAKSSGREVALRAMIERFEKANPAIRVRVEPQVFSELTSKFLAGHNTGTAPDVVWVNIENVGPLARSGAAASLNPLFIDGWPAGAQQDFSPKAAWEAGMAGGKQFAMPLFLSTSCLFYRRDLLAAAGVDPAKLRTWDALAEAAKKLTTAGEGQAGGIWGFATPLGSERTGGTTAFVTMMRSGGPVWDGCTPLYTAENGRRAVQWHADMIAKHKAMSRETITSSVDDIVDRFTAGRFAISVIPFVRYDIIRQTAKWDTSQLAILPWPSWSGKTPGPSEVTAWWASVWSRSRNPAQAAKWLEYMSGEEAGELWTSGGGQIPARQSVWKQPQFRDGKYAAMSTVIDGLLQDGIMVPTNCNMTRFDSDLNQAVQRVLVSGASVEDATKEAARAFTARQS